MILDHDTDVRYGFHDRLRAEFPFPDHCRHHGGLQTGLRVLSSARNNKRNNGRAILLIAKSGGESGRSKAPCCLGSSFLWLIGLRSKYDKRLH